MAKTVTVEDYRALLDTYHTEAMNLSEKVNGLRSKERTPEIRTELQNATGDLVTLDALMRVATRAAEDTLQRTLDAAGDGPRGGTRSAETPEFRSAGQQFVENENYRNWNGSGSVEVRTLVAEGAVQGFGAFGIQGANLLRPIGTPVIPPATIYRQRLFIRDVLGSVQTGLASVPYIQEKDTILNTNATNGAQFVGEGQQKKETALNWEPKDAPIRKIAAWIPATYEILQDAPTLRGYIDSRLRYMLALAEERGILNGDGTGANLTGLLAAGVSTQVFSADPFVSLGLTMAKLEIAQGEPSFIAMNPADYWAMQTTRYATHFEGTYGAGTNVSPFGTPPSEVWGVPVVRTVGLVTGKALVGCRDAAVIYDREEATVRVGDQHLDYFTTNRVAILAEKRIGLAIHRPDWLVLTDLV